MPVPAFARRPPHHFEPHEVAQKVELMAPSAFDGHVIDFLQADDAGVERVDHPRYPRHVTLAVAAHASVDVVRRDDDPPLAAHHPSFASRSDVPTDRRARRKPLRMTQSAATMAASVTTSAITLSSVGCKSMRPMRSANSVNPRMPGRIPS